MKSFNNLVFTDVLKKKQLHFFFVLITINIQKNLDDIIVNNLNFLILFLIQKLNNVKDFCFQA